MGSFEDKSNESIGFIGLGAMGLPMARHLANKLPPETRIHVFDVAQEVMDKLCSEFPKKVFKSASAKEVAQLTVRSLPSIEITNLYLTSFYRIQ